MPSPKSRRLLALVFGPVLLCAATSNAQPAYRVKDIATGTRTGSVSVLDTPVEFGNAVYFGATGPGSNEQLWRSDGTAEGTAKLRDFDVLGFTPPASLTVVGSRLLFFVDGSLRATDGSAEGISVVKDFGPGATPYSVVAAGDTLFFLIDDGIHGDELWKSDGSTAGTSLVADLEPGAGDSSISYLTPQGEIVYFFRPDSDGEVSLWLSDGTEEGTVRVRTLEPGVYPAGHSIVVSSGSFLFFVTIGGPDQGLPFRLWRSDGTEDGTIPLRNFAAEFCPGICRPYGPSDLTALGNLALFLGSDGVHGRELWKSDGTPAGTVLVKDVFPGPGSGLSFGLVRAGDRAYFIGADREHGSELWKSDGTPAGTALVKDIDPGPNSSHGYPLAALGDRVVFQTGEYGGTLWISDGTAAGTAFLFSRVSEYPHGFVPLDGSLLFLTSVGGGSNIWRTDGTEAGTRRVEDFATGASSYPYSLSPVGGWLAFFVQDRGVFDTDTELWGSDGSEAGTTRLGTFRFNDSGFVTTAALAGAFYFGADDVTHGTELWRSDGTPEGTALVADVAPGQGESFPRAMTVADSRLYFAAWNGERLALWTSDGTASGTVQVSDAVAPLDEGDGLALLGNLLVFAGTDEINGGELWRSDGTPQGTVLVKDINPGTGWSSITRFARLSGKLYFAAFDGASYGLWSTDGTAAGTVRVREFDIPFGFDLTAAGPLLFFSSDDASELWVSDGTEAGTRKLMDVRAWNLTAVGSTLFFIGDDGLHGFELWRSDGTPAGTLLVRDIRRGVAWSVFPSASKALLVIDNRLVFAASDEEHGSEVWVSDGTEAGTVMLQDIAPGKPSSLPQYFTRSGDRIFFAADDGITGVELWAMPATSDPSRIRRLTPLPPNTNTTRALPPRP